MKYKIIPLNLGMGEMGEKSRFTYFENFGEKMRIVYIAWIVDGGGKKILIDSGPGNGEWARMYRGKNLTPGPAGDLAGALSRLAIDPAELDLVICTHLHWDHCIDSRIFPNAKFLVQNRELIHAVNPIPSQKVIYGWVGNEVAPFLWVSGRYEIIKGDKEILPGIDVIFTPGHTPGSQGVLVNTGSTRFFIASDTIPLFENWETRTPSGIHVNLEEYEDSFKRIESLKDVFVLPGHDPRVFDRDQYF